MAFGITRSELKQWKDDINLGKLAFLTHYWRDERFPNIKTVTKVGCLNLAELAEWGKKYQLEEKWIHHRKDGYSHFDLLGAKQTEVLEREGLLKEVMDKFMLAECKNGGNNYEDTHNRSGSKMV